MSGSLEQRYAAAARSTNLRMVLDQPCVMDVIAAAGMAQLPNEARVPHQRVFRNTMQEIQIGGELLHMRNSFDATRTSHASTAAHYTDFGFGHKDASRMARETNLIALAAITPRLPEFQRVCDLLTAWALCIGITTRAELKVIECLGYWLYSTCGQCNGTKWQLIPGTVKQSTKACAECGGTGIRPLPFAADGVRLMDYIEKCVIRALSEMGAHL